LGFEGWGSQAAEAPVPLRQRAAAGEAAAVADSIGKQRDGMGSRGQTPPQAESRRREAKRRDEGRPSAVLATLPALSPRRAGAAGSAITSRPSSADPLPRVKDASPRAAGTGAVEVAPAETRSSLPALPAIGRGGALTSLGGLPPLAGKGPFTTSPAPAPEARFGSGLYKDAAEPEAKPKKEKKEKREKAEKKERKERSKSRDRRVLADGGKSDGAGDGAVDKEGVASERERHKAKKRHKDRKDR